MIATFQPNVNPNDIFNSLFNETVIKIEGSIKETNKVCKAILDKLAKMNIKNVNYNITKGEISIVN